MSNIETTYKENMSDTQDNYVETRTSSSSNDDDSLGPPNEVNIRHSPSSRRVSIIDIMLYLID